MSCWGFLLALERSALGRSSASSAVVSLFFFFLQHHSQGFGIQRAQNGGKGLNEEPETSLVETPAGILEAASWLTVQLVQHPWESWTAESRNIRTFS